MRRVSRLFLFALALASVSGRPALAGEATDRLVRTVPLAAGRPIRVEATIADLKIIGSNRPDVSIEIVRHAPAAGDLARFPALVEDTPSGLRVTALQTGDGRDAALRSDIVIRAPAGAVFEAVRVSEGHVTLQGLRQSCDVDLRRGVIDASALAGRIRLESGIGGIDVKDSELTPGGMMRLRVFNGPLRVRFARVPASARILAVTFNGSLTSDIPLTLKDQFGPRFGETTIGAGDPVMSLDVVKGDITIGVSRR
jgi:hypothetical protein